MKRFHPDPGAMIFVGVLGISMSSILVKYSAAPAAVTAVCGLWGQELLGYGSSPVIVGAALAVFSTILGHSIFSWCLKYYSPAFVSATKLCEPAAASVLAAVLFGQIPSPMQLVGGGLILGGVLWYSRIEQKEQ